MSAVSLSCDPGSQDQLRAVPVWITERRIMKIIIVFIFILVAIFCMQDLTNSEQKQQNIKGNKTN
jgi:hypothetical protein